MGFCIAAKQLGATFRSPDPKLGGKVVSVSLKQKGLPIQGAVSVRL
jgi:hypothetical protein